MSAALAWNVIVVGAGHNGLAATALLAKRGLRVLCLEKNGYVGGMAGTREILSGCRNDVGASLLFPLAKGISDELELERHGALEPRQAGDEVAEALAGAPARPAAA